MSADTREVLWLLRPISPQLPLITISCILVCLSGSQKPALGRDGVERSQPPGSLVSTGSRRVSCGLREPLAPAPGQAVLCLGEGAGGGPEDFLGTQHGSCFLTWDFHCSLQWFCLLYFTAREAWMESMSCQTMRRSGKTNLKIKNAVQRIWKDYGKRTGEGFLF